MDRRRQVGKIEAVGASDPVPPIATALEEGLKRGVKDVVVPDSG